MAAKKNIPEPVQVPSGVTSVELENMRNASINAGLLEPDEPPPVLPVVDVASAIVPDHISSDDDKPAREDERPHRSPFVTNASDEDD